METTVSARGNKINLLDVSLPKLCRILNAARRMPLPRLRVFDNTLNILIKRREARVNDQDVVVPTFNEWVA